jgi:hypothetical protein
MSTTPIKSEFIDVITDSTLLSATTTEPLTTVTTERTIVDTTSDSLSSPEPLTPQQLIDRYNTLFTTPDIIHVSRICQTEVISLAQPNRFSLL